MKNDFPDSASCLDMDRYESVIVYLYGYHELVMSDDERQALLVWNGGRMVTVPVDDSSAALIGLGVTVDQLYEQALLMQADMRLGDEDDDALFRVTREGSTVLLHIDPVIYHAITDDERDD